MARRSVRLTSLISADPGGAISATLAPPSTTPSPGLRRSGWTGPARYTSDGHGATSVASTAAFRSTPASTACVATTIRTQQPQPGLPGRQSAMAHDRIPKVPSGTRPASGRDVSLVLAFAEGGEDDAGGHGILAGLFRVR